MNYSEFKKDKFYSKGLFKRIKYELHLRRAKFYDNKFLAAAKELIGCGVENHHIFENYKCDYLLYPIDCDAHEVKEFKWNRAKYPEYLLLSEALYNFFYVSGVMASFTETEAHKCAIAKREIFMKLLLEDIEIFVDSLIEQFKGEAI